MRIHTFLVVNTRIFASLQRPQDRSACGVVFYHAFIQALRCVVTLHLLYINYCVTALRSLNKVEFICFFFGTCNLKQFEIDMPLRGYCTPSRKLTCFVCFLLHREENQYFLCMVVTDVCDSKSKSMIFFPWINESLMWNGSKYFFPFQPKKSL